MKTQKILSLLLAALMVLTALPLTFIGAAAEEQATSVVETETVGSKTYETVVVYSQRMNPTKNFTVYEPDDGMTAATLEEASGKDLDKAVGVLMDVSWSGLSSAPKILFRWYGASYAAKNVIYYGTSNGNSVSGSYSSDADGGTSGVAMVSYTDFTGTLFFPRDTLVSWSNAPRMQIVLNGYQTAATDTIYFENIRIAWDAESEALSEYPAINGLHAPLFRQTSYTGGDFYSTKYDWLTTVTDKSASALFDADAGSLLKDSAQGMMFNVKSASSYYTLLFDFYMQVKWNNDKNQTYISPTPYGAVSQNSSKTSVPAGATSTWYISKDGTNWTSHVIDFGNLRYGLLSLEKNANYYVYIPMSEFWTKDGETVLKGGTQTATKEDSVNFETLRSIVGDSTMKVTNIKFDLSGKLGASERTNVTFSNFVLVCQNEELPNGELYTTENAFNGDYTFSYTENNKTEMSIFTSTAANALNNGDGMMFVADATNVASGDKLRFKFQLRVYGNNGTVLWVASNLAEATKSGTVAATDKSSTLYWSKDCKTWTAVTDSSDYFQTGLTGGAKYYIYIPFSSMYAFHGETYINTAGAEKVTGEAPVSLDQAREMMGGIKKADKIKVSFGYNTKMDNNGITDMKFVYGGEFQSVQSASVTITDDLAYNVYAKVPWGATSSAAQFTFGSETVEAVGVRTEKNIYKYSFKNILPQQMDDDVAFTWTATVNGNTVTDTHTGSVQAYVEKLLATDSYAAYHALAEAMLVYGGTVQEYKGQDNTINPDSKYTVKYPVDPEAFANVYNNEDSSVWSTMRFVLDNSLTMKFGVGNANGATQAVYTIGGGSAIVTDIVDGYVLVPIAATQIADEVVVQLYDGSAAIDGTTLTITPMFYLANVTTTNDADAALIQAVTNYTGAAVELNELLTTTLTSETLAQMAITDSQGGMSYVIQLTDGRFIVIDGGFRDTEDQGHLFEYLKLNSTTAKPVIAAWIFTHIHKDHTMNGFDILQNRSSEIVLEKVYYAFQTDTTLFSAQSDINAINDNMKRLNDYIKPLYSDAEFINMNTGNQYTIGGVTIDVLIDESKTWDTFGEAYKHSTSDHNDFSAALKFTFSSGKTFLVLGDCTAERLQALAANYDLASDVLQASHHGLVGGDKGTYKEVAPSITLYPTKYSTLYNYKYHGSANHFWNLDYNSYLREISDCYYCSTDANDTKVRTVVIDTTDLSVSDWWKLPIDVNDELE